MKYKVGDKVRVKADLYFGGNYGIACNNDMPHYAGVETVITHITKFGNYALLADKGANYWSADMLEPAEEQKKVFVFPEWAKWIARDADGSLWVHENEPYRNTIYSTWEAELGDAKRVPENAYPIPEISWEDKPVPINLHAPTFTAIDPDDSNRSIYTPVTDEQDPKVLRHKQITEELTAIYEAKNHDYGDSFQETYRKLGLISAVTRITDKVNRLQSLSKKEQRVADESIRDTLVDCANYCIMTIIALEGTE